MNLNILLKTRSSSGEQMGTELKNKDRTGEVAQQLRGTAALPGQGFSPQHPRRNTQPSLTPVPGDPIPTELHRHQAYMWYTYMQVGTCGTHTCK